MYRIEKKILAYEFFFKHHNYFLSTGRIIKSPEILRETFVPKTSSYNLRRNDASEKCKMHCLYGAESLLF